MPECTEKIDYLRALDGLRGVAILLVLVCHSRDILFGATGFCHSFTLYRVAEQGFVGVELFFAISGFIITHRLLQEEAARGHVNVANFFLRRIFRLLPAACAYLIMMVCLSLVHLIRLSGQEVVACLACVRDHWGGDGWFTGHFWSLSEEERFYLIWPVLIVLSAGLARRCLVALLAILGSLCWFHWLSAFCAVYMPHLGQVVDFVVFHADEFLWGALGALIFPYIEPKYRGLPVNLFACLAMAFTVGVCAWYPWLAEVRSLVFGLLVLLVSLRPTGVCATCLAARPVVYVGRLSYSIYLWQQLFLILGNRAPVFWPVQNTWLAWPAIAAAATMSYYFVEQPGRRIGRRLGRALDNGRETALD